MSLVSVYEGINPFVFTAQACHACFKRQGEEGAVLQRCKKCGSVKYCSTECQKENWDSHKTMCKALNRLLNDKVFRDSVADVPTTPYQDLQMLNMDIEASACKQLAYLKSLLKRQLSTTEQNMIACEARCMACGRSDRMLRAEAANSPESDTVPTYLKACGTCNLAFYCSQSHWDAVRHHHTEEPCEDGHDGSTQCQMNKELQKDVEFTNKSPKISPVAFGTLDRIKPSWESLKNTSWENGFLNEIIQTFGGSTETACPRLRLASIALSMPMTILWALEHLNSDDKWTQSKTLTIHVLGAYETEISNAKIFEEILHRLPEVKTLQIVFCGPQLSTLPKNEIRICCKCTSRKRKVIQHYSAQRYHDYAKALGNKLFKPNLAVAFNSGSSQEETSSWRETVAFLIKNNIPSTFTAYNRKEAEDEAEILQTMGANLVPVLGPVKNIWGSILFRKEPVKVTGFYSDNSWLPGGFR